MSTKSLTIKNLMKIYPSRGTQETEVHAVDDISLDIKAGEFITLLGPSGCGKTTTLRMIAGFEKPSSGEILLGDQVINNLSPDKRDTAMVFQTYALFPNYNVWDNIAYGLKLRKLPGNVIEQKVKSIIDLVDLKGLEKRHTNQLSGGQQQRVAVARALVLEPGLLLFDEPLSNLDAKLRVQMRTEIRKLQQQVGITSVYVTHDQAEAMSMSDRIVILNKGKIAQVGSPKEIYYHPESEFVANFIGTANIIKGVIRGVNSYGTMDVEVFGQVLRNISGSKHSVGDECSIVIRPEACSLSDEGLFKSTVQLSIFMGSYQYYEASIGEDTFIVHENNPNNKKIFDNGATACINLNLKDIHIL